MSTRTKFRCDMFKNVWKKDNRLVGTVGLSPVYSIDPGSENKAFWDATPSGSIEMQINNPDGFATFELGKEYYVDFTSA